MRGLKVFVEHSEDKLQGEGHCSGPLSQVCPSDSKTSGSGSTGAIHSVVFPAEIARDSICVPGAYWPHTESTRKNISSCGRGLRVAGVRNCSYAAPNSRNIRHCSSDKLNPEPSSSAVFSSRSTSAVRTASPTCNVMTTCVGVWSSVENVRSSEPACMIERVSERNAPSILFAVCLLTSIRG